MGVKLEAEMMLLGSCRMKNPTEEKRTKRDVTRSSLGSWPLPECWWLLPAVPGSVLCPELPLQAEPELGPAAGHSGPGLGQPLPWEPGEGSRRQGRVLLGSRGTPPAGAGRATLVLWCISNRKDLALPDFETAALNK